MLLYITGWRPFCIHIELMTGFQLSIVWKVTWLVACPTGITVSQANCIINNIHNCPHYFWIYERSFQKWACIFTIFQAVVFLDSIGLIVSPIGAQTVLKS